MLAAAALALPAASGWAAPSLSLPLACDIGTACIVQNYVDRDAGPGARDYRCGFLAYDGHNISASSIARSTDRASRCLLRQRVVCVRFATA